MAIFSEESQLQVQIHCLVCHGTIKYVDDVADKKMHPTHEVNCPNHYNVGMVGVCGKCGALEDGPLPWGLSATSLLYKDTLEAVQSGEVFAAAEEEREQRKQAEDWWMF